MWHSNWEHVSGSIEVNAVYEQLHQKYVRYLFRIKACVTFDHPFLERLFGKAFQHWIFSPRVMVINLEEQKLKLECLLELCVGVTFGFQQT